jgi:DHA2 family multidrug resistance protein
VQELTTARPWLNLHYTVSGNLPLLFVSITFLRGVILSTSYVIPQYLTIVQGYRAMEIGGVLIWIALPQLVLAPIVATILRYIDARLTMAVGFAFMGCACFMAGQLTDQWIGVDFLPSQIVQAIGQSVGLTSLVWLALRHVRPDQILSFGAILQTGRLFGAEIGSGLVQTFVRVREQVYSNLIGLHVAGGTTLTDQRLLDYSHAVFGRSIGLAQANARGVGLLAEAVARQAYVLAFVDAFMVLGFAVMVVLALMLFLRTPPDPANPAR